MWTKRRKAMDKKDVQTAVQKTARVTGTVVRKGLGFGLILLNVAATAVGAIVCAVTSQD